jgi:lipopolysaccharide/colanic/teichoic acid biosynthesis glycosyltransferase
MLKCVGTRPDLIMLVVALAIRLDSFGPVLLRQQRVEDDLCYMRNWSIWLDLRILWMTVGAVLCGEGAC